MTSAEANPYPEGSLAFAMREIGAGRRRMPESEAKRHHIVPRFLLARFAEPPGDNDGHLAQLDTTSGATARVSVRTAATRHRFYSVRSTEAEKDNRIESLIGLVEDHAAEAMDLLLECPERMGDHDRIAIAIFIALQVQRTPKALARAEAMIRETAEAVLREQVGDPGTFARAARGQGVELSAAQLERMRHELRRAMAEGRLRAKYVREEAWRGMVDNLLEAGRHPLEMEWYLLRAGEGEYVASDNGISVVRNADGELETALPLSPDACLVLTGQGDGLKRIRVPGEAVADLNLRTYADAERFIFGHDQGVVTKVRDLAVS
ncbi:MAG TPA: DUF4238 domain-containing protein [Solirubrobacterales bacterium]